MSSIVPTEPQRHPAARAVVDGFHRDLVEEVRAIVARDPWVIVGMAQNPVVKKARKLLDAQGVRYTYLEYGSYLSQWRRRLAIKLWAGFPTFPMVFHEGMLLGGYSELRQLLRDGAVTPSKGA